MRASILKSASEGLSQIMLELCQDPEEEVLMNLWNTHVCWTSCYTCLPSQSKFWGEAWHIRAKGVAEERKYLVAGASG